MPDNTNPQAVDFANSKARVFASALLSAVLTAKEYKSFYDANGMDAAFPLTPDPIADGSERDGCPRVTNMTIRALYTVASDIVTWAATGTPTRESRLRTIAVDGSSKF